MNNYPPRVRELDAELMTRLIVAVGRLNAQLSDLRKAGLVAEFEVVEDGDGGVLELTRPKVYRVFPNGDS